MPNLNQVTFRFFLINKYNWRYACYSILQDCSSTISSQSPNGLLILYASIIQYILGDKTFTITNKL
jgi:hypothetical protein